MSATACVPMTTDVHLIYIEEIIAAHLDMLFPGLDVVAAFPFRITRDADLEIEVDEASDLLTTVEEIMEQRAKGKPCVSKWNVPCMRISAICWRRNWGSSRYDLPGRPPCRHG